MNATGTVDVVAVYVCDNALQVYYIKKTMLEGCKTNKLPHVQDIVGICGKLSE